MADRQNTRRKNSPGGKPGEGVPVDPGFNKNPPEDLKRDSPEDVKNWLQRHTQKAQKGGLLSGPFNEEGVGGTQLIDLLKSNPELAGRVREWTKGQAKEYRSMPGLERTGGRQDALFQAFPELYQQYMSASGQGIVYDAEGNPVRVSDEENPGMREGDSWVPPSLIGPTGEQIPLPELGASETENQFLAARERRMQAETGGGSPVFSLEDLQGGEE